jgi:hypothetical protein
MMSAQDFLQSLENADGKMPLLTLAEFFEGNENEDSLAPNQWGYGRPRLADIWERLREVEARADVAWMRVQLHPDTCVEEQGDGEIECDIAADSIALCTNADSEKLADALNTDWLCSDGVLEGWGTYGDDIHVEDIPDVPVGYRIVSLVWD